METSYSINRNNRNFKWPVLIAIILISLALIAYFLFGNSKRFISPLPDEPAVEIIFYTPTPLPITPTSSPSATPKSAAKPSVTKTPVSSPSITPSGGAPTTTKIPATSTPSN